MCTIRSLIVLASLRSSIILSNPKALSLPLISPFAAFLRRELPILDAEEWTDPSRLGVGVVERERGEAGSVLVEVALEVASSRVGRALDVTLAAFTVAALSLTGVSSIRWEG